MQARRRGGYPGARPAAGGIRRRNCWPTGQGACCDCRWTDVLPTCAAAAGRAACRSSTGSWCCRLHLSDAAGLDIAAGAAERDCARTCHICCYCCWAGGTNVFCSSLPADRKGLDGGLHICAAARRAAHAPVRATQSQRRWLRLYCPPFCGSSRVGGLALCELGPPNMLGNQSPPQCAPD